MYARRNLMSSDDKLKETVFFIEANDFERHQIWRELHEKYEYDHDSMGSGAHIGNIKGDPELPVNVQFLFSYLKGYRVCMYSATSRYVDNTMIENYIKSKYPVKYDKDRRTAICDANHYHEFIVAIKELEEQKAKQDGTTA